MLFPLIRKPFKFDSRYPVDIPHGLIDRNCSAIGNYAHRIRSFGVVSPLEFAGPCCATRDERRSEVESEIRRCSSSPTEYVNAKVNEQSKHRKKGRRACEETSRFVDSFQPKYFDSGDYNVAKAQGKLPASKPDPTAKNQSNNVEAADMVPETITGHEIPTPETLMPRKLSCATSLMSTPTATSSSAQSNNTLSPPSMQ